MLIGTHHSLIGLVRRHLAASEDTPASQPTHAQLASEVVTRGREALDLLERGLANYATKPTHPAL